MRRKNDGIQRIEYGGFKIEFERICMRWFFVPVRDDEGKVIGYFERHEMHWDFSAPGKPVAVPKPEAGY
jgi:hypothetical protein